MDTNPCTTVWELARELGASTGSISKHLNKIGKSKMLNKWIAHELNETKIIVLMKSVQFFCTTLLISQSHCDMINGSHDKWPHVTQGMLQNLNKLGSNTLPHPLYSPELSPTDYHLFKQLDNFLQWKVFNNSITVQNAFKDFVASQTSMQMEWQHLYLVGKSNGSDFD